MKKNKRKIRNQKFTVSLSKEITNAVQIYCETIEIEPKEFIRDAIVKDLMRTYTEIQSEEFIYIATKVPEVKRPLKKCLEAMKMAIKIN